MYTVGGVINPLNPNPNIGALAGVGLGSIF